MGGYESNIFLSHADSLQTSALLYLFNGSASWRTRFSRVYSQRAVGYCNWDVYPNYSRRNRSTFGFKFQPKLHYNKKGRFELEFDGSHVDNDLIDDSGQLQPRTYKRWSFESRGFNRYDISRVRLEQGVKYSKQNYDEVVGLKSYDYYAWALYSDIRVAITAALVATASYSGEKRNYTERRTYTVRYGAVAGRPFAIRNSWENTVELSLRYELIEKGSFEVSAEYSELTENFENFYGFAHWQYRATVDLRLIERNRTGISFRFKDRQYPNYWTSRIGINNRVWTDYADFQVENAFYITPSIGILLFIRDYNKVSNDPTLDYPDVTVGSGVTISY